MAAKKKKKAVKGKKRSKAKKKASKRKSKGQVPNWVIAKRARKLNGLLARRKIDINMKEPK